MGLLSGSRPQICEGCEFAGSITPDSDIIYASRKISGDVRETVLVDSEFNLSAGIVSCHIPEESPESGDVRKLLANTGRVCRVSCVLEQQGFVPVQLSDDSKRAALEGLLNEFPGVKALGEVEFVDDNGGGDDTGIVEPVGSLEIT